MNNIKFYLSLLGAFIFQIIALGTLNILLKEPFFTKGNLVNSVIATTMIGFFASRERKKRALKSKK
ncbi:hypothetical protein ACODHD_12420 [Vagococcus fluvialis]|uniref:hypothetical protein n=1 Tax=Vagococcus fluvialis TaxID=2738 RepID=UPI003B58B4BB